jgi:hypothetical protein
VEGEGNGDDKDVLGRKEETDADKGRDECDVNEGEVKEVA